MSFLNSHFKKEPNKRRALINMQITIIKCIIQVKVNRQTDLWKHLQKRIDKPLIAICSTAWNVRNSFENENQTESNENHD